MLTVDQKRQRVVDSKRCLELFRRNKPNFLRRYVTMDETWIHHYTPESKRSSAEWTAVGETRPKRPKTQMWAGKVMASVFWGAHRDLFIDYLEKGINRERYISHMMHLKNEFGEKRLQMRKKKVLFHQDNAPCHKSLATMAKLNELSFKMLPHPPYSTDLAPSDYHLFADLKKMLQGKRFYSNEEVITEYAIELVTYLLALVVYFNELIVYMLLEKNAFDSIAFFSQCKFTHLRLYA